MSQETNIIDLRRPFIPIDPNSFPATYHTTVNEDSPEPHISVVPYDMANCMPTAQGYASYFGLNSNLGIATLAASGGTGNVDDLFLIQTSTFVNILVALCDDGIWTKQGSSAGNWTHEVTLTAPAAGTHKNWSKCVLENTVFVYRQAEAHLWRCRATESYVFTETTPNTLNMSGQLGIFKAGGRLGFWDSENSTGWSVLGAPIVANVIDFVQSQRTLAGATTFQDIVGRIVNVLQHGTGFIIYATKSIVHVIRNPASPSLFSGRAIFNNNGISYREEACYGEPDTQHYAMTTQGFVSIENGNAKFEIPDVSTYLKEKRQPVYLKMMNGRYLFFPLLDPAYFNGITKFQTEEFGPLGITFKGASYAVEHVEENVCRAHMAGMTQVEGRYLFDTYGFTSKSQATDTASVPIWEDHLSTLVILSLLEAWKAAGVTGNGSISYFDDKFTAQGGIAKITSGTEYFIPTGMLTTAAYAFQANMCVEPNTRDFWDKQDWLWHYEGNMFEHWKEAISRKTHDSIVSDLLFASAGPSTSTLHTFGPYIDLSFFSESNKYYGIAEKSAWLQRSLTRGVYVKIIEYIDFDASEVGWIQVAGSTQIMFNSYAEIIAGGPTYATFLLGFPGVTTCTYNSLLEFAGSIGSNRRIQLNFTLNGSPVELTFYPARSTADPNNMTQPDNVRLYLSSSDFTPALVLATGVGVNTGKTQRFSRPEFKYVDFDTCVYKELGYTQITGHGHYSITGTFVQDNTTDEAVDYVDVCDDDPDKRRKALFNGVFVPGSAQDGGFMCAPAAVEINSVDYAFPDESVSIPGGENFLQNGSIEPIYPTYLGAFVYDTQLKKWGKMVQSYKQLLDYFPINDSAGDQPIPYDAFLPKGSLLAPDGLIYLFDQFPLDSFITFGKFGRYRKGFTDLEEVHIQNRTPLSGTVTAEGSLDGRSIEIGLAKTVTYENAIEVSEGFGLSARWYNITIEGNYDLTNLELRSSRKGKR